MPTPTPVAAPMFFISYRRDDSGGHVGRLYDALVGRFGAKRLFFDIDHIGAGQDFVDVLDDAIKRCSVLLVVMGKRWVGPGEGGTRRIDDPGDFVRMEVAAGLKRQGLRIIPVLVNGATMPGPDALPDDLKGLTRRNAVELSDMRWREDVTRLIHALARDVTPFGSAPGFAVPSLRALPPWGKWAGVSAGGALALGLVAYAMRPASHGGTTAAQAANVSTPPPVAMPTGPVAVPRDMTGAAKSVLADARREWRKDLILTQIDAHLTSAGKYGTTYTFYSPTDGEGWGVETGLPDSPKYSKPSAQPIESLHALPENFVDLPEAISAARKDGRLYGQVQQAVLNMTGPRGSTGPQPTWHLKPATEQQYRAYYVDATSGKYLRGSGGSDAALATTTTGTASKGKKPDNVFQSVGNKLNRLFSH